MTSHFLKLGFDTSQYILNVLPSSVKLGWCFHWSSKLWMKYPHVVVRTWHDLSSLTLVNNSSWVLYRMALEGFICMELV